MIELAGSFVPATDDMQHMRTFGIDADFFALFSEDGHYGHDRGPYGTRQGYYAVTPSGKLLASSNKRDPSILVPMFRHALETYAKMSPEERLLPKKELEKKRDTSRYDDGLYPADGLVLLQYVRDLPEPGEDASTVSGNWNLDYLWFKKSELPMLVPRGTKVGSKVEWPRTIETRIARLHLIDTVNGLRFGQRPMFAVEDVKTARIVAEIVGVEGTRVKLRLTGESRTSSNKPRARGVALTALGHAVFDRATGRFVEFELAALGRRWGGTGEGKSNDRANETGPRPIGFTWKLAGDTPAEHVPPLYVQAYGW